MITRRHLEYFVAVADQGSFSRAAESLGVSQPTISQSIKTLERHIGKELVERRGNQFQVTETGTELLRWCQRILINFSEAERALKLFKTNDLLRISAPSVLAKHPIENTVCSIASKWPQSSIEIYDQKSANEVWDSVMSNQIDIGFTNDYQKSALDTVLIGEHRLVCAFPPNDSTSPSPTISLEEVSTYRWIVGPPPNYYRRRLLEEHLHARGLSYDLHIVTAHRHIMQNLVLNGVGPAIIIQEEAEEYESLGAKIRFIEPAIRRRYYMLYKRSYLSEIARDFVDHVTHTWSDLPICNAF